MPSLELNLFNSFQARLKDKLITTFRSANVQGLLVYLALNAEQPQARETLAALFWPDVPDSTARQNLLQSLYQLRKVLGAKKGDQDPFLLINRHSVQFNINSNHSLDVAQFQQAIAAEEWQTASGLYIGELLLGFTCDSLQFEEWLLNKREQLHRQALDALFQLAKQQLAQADFAAAQTTARRQLAFEPWREEAHRQLMLALAQNGERSASLAQFDSCRQILADELGTEPSGETTAVYEQILADDMNPSQPQKPIPTPHNLPAHVTPYFGREEDRALLLKRVSGTNHRFITLVGEGGIGKSRLSQEIGWQAKAQFADGVWFVPLAGRTNRASADELEDDIATAIAAAMGHTLRGKTPPKEQLLSIVRERQALLLLDNFEHLLDGADIVVDLLQEAQQLQVICTSREPLGFMAEWVYRLEHLPLPPVSTVVLNPELVEGWIGEPATTPLESYPSVQLFLDRAERANGRFALTPANQDQVTHLCRLAEGIPLALELAAAGLRQWSLAELIDAMQNALDALATRFRDVPARHRTVRAVFESSWQLLTEAEQTLFASLSVFRGGFTLAAAKAIAAATEAQLEGLLGKSLLQLSKERYQLHELLRQFAAEKLPEAARLVHFLKMDQSLASKHSTYFLDFVAEQEQVLVGPTPQIPAQAIAADLDNIRLAWETAVQENAATRLLACANGLADFYQIRGLYQEAEGMLGTAVSSLESDSDTIVLATLMTHQAGMRVRLSQYDSASELIEETLRLIGGENGRYLRGRLYILLGETFYRQGKLKRSEQHLQTALKIAHSANANILVGWSAFHLGILHDLRSERHIALTFLEEALNVWDAARDQRKKGFTLNSLGVVSLNLKSFSQAQKYLTKALDISRANKDQQGQSAALNNLGLVAIEHRLYKKANSHLFQALALARSSGDIYFQALLYRNLGWCAQEAKQWTEAEYFLGQSLNLNRQLGDKPNEEAVLEMLTEVTESKMTAAEF
ncbi:MAG: BTAD domain-containing putative transcriptional regulator, partial [Chloroflexota bacterium]